MENTNIAKQLRLMADMVESWDGSAVPAIEKDTVLEALRRLYGDIKYNKGDENGAVPAGAESVAGVCTSGEPASRPSEIPAGPISEVTPYAENCSEGPVEEDRLSDHVDTTVVPSTAPNVTPSPAGGYDLDITTAPGTEGTSPDDNPHIVNSQDEKEEFKENILFAEDEFPVRQKLDRRTILSLYGEEPAAVKPAETASAATPVTDREEPGYRLPYESEPSGQPSHGDVQPVQVLGDVLGGGSQTVSDMYATQPEVTDVASVVGSGRIDSIRKTIGINDKFLLIRNLFDGNAEIYESVITTLENFNELDDALIYIHENFHWNPDSDAVKLLVDILTRKLA